MAIRLFVIFLFFGVNHSRALNVANGSAGSPNRFLNFPEAPVFNPDFMFADVHLTGVGWAGIGAKRRSVTLVSPKHFLYASHYKVQVGTIISFVAADGTIVQRELLQNHSPIPLIEGAVNSDLTLAELSEPIHASSGVVHQPYLNNDTNLSDSEFYAQSYLGDLIVFGADQRAGTGVNDPPDFDVDRSPLDHPTAYVQFSSISDPPDGAARVQGGDSGSPTLVKLGLEAAIVSVHGSRRIVDGYHQVGGSFVGSDHGVDRINEIMEQDGYHMTEFFAGQGEVDLVIEPIPVIVRHGEVVDLNLHFENVGDAEVHNLSLRILLENNVSLLHGPLSSGWVETSVPGIIEYRKGGLMFEQDSSFKSDLRFDIPGDYEFSVSLNFDGGEEVLRNFNIKVTPEPTVPVLIVFAIGVFCFFRNQDPLK